MHSFFSCKLYNDYGLGFYCTEEKNLAKEWAVDFKRDGFVNQYIMDETNLKILYLNKEPYCTLHWLALLLANRRFDASSGLASAAKEYIQELLQMYDKYHEMDIQAFVDRVDEITHESRRESRLKRYRKLVGLSQRELAERTGIPVRTIQQYEQRQKNINKAQVDYMIRLSKVLYCEPRDLMEKNF